jgi:hypothetical protein
MEGGYGMHSLFEVRFARWIVIIIHNTKMSDSNEDRDFDSDLEDNDHETNDIGAGGPKSRRRGCVQGGRNARKLPRHDARNNTAGGGMERAAASVTPFRMLPPGPGGRTFGINANGVPPALSVSSGSSVSCLSQTGFPSNNGMHNSETTAVREYVRTEIYPRKKTIFCDKELMYGSPLANNVIQHMLYANNGFYRGKKPTTFIERRSTEVGFWTRNQEIVRRVLKEKVNNSLSRFKEKLESKCCKVPFLYAWVGRLNCGLTPCLCFRMAKAGK